LGVISLCIVISAGMRVCIYAGCMFFCVVLTVTWLCICAMLRLNRFWLAGFSIINWGVVLFGCFDCSISCSVVGCVSTCL